eukprot:bmy_20337T0
MTTSGALFPSLVPGSRGSSNKYLVEFRAGKMSLKGTTVTPDKRKGLVYIQQTDDSLIHFCWKDRTSGNVEDDLIIFPDDCEFKRVPQCPSGRVYVLKFKAGSKRLFFWMQEPKTDQDEEHCRKVNEYLNNPPMPGALGASGSGGHELSALGGGLGALTGPGLASLLGSGGPPASSSSSSSRSQSAAVTPSSTTSSTRATPAPSAPAAASTTSPSPAPSSGNGTSTAASPTQPIQLSDLQSILATMNVPAGPGGGQQGNTCSSAPGWGVKAPAAPCPPAGFPRHGSKHVPGPSCCPARVASSSPHLASPCPAVLQLGVCHCPPEWASGLAPSR